MKKFFFAFLIFICFAVFNPPTASFAHLGGGPPFLVVDGVYGITNPYYFNDTTINIPQDYTGKTYLVNKPIHFFVDTDKLLVPPDIANASTFRWTMEENSTNYKFGKSLVYTYTKPGSYILSLEVKAPGETVFTLIDTIQMDVLPNTSYKLPHATMSIQTTHRESTKPMLFQSSFGVDSSTNIQSIIWGFGDGATAQTQNALHTYTDLQDYSTFPVVFRVTDANGFRGYAGVIIEATKGTVHFVDNNGKENPIPVSDTISQNTPKQITKKQSSSFVIWIIFGGLIGVGILVVVTLLQKKNKR